MRHSILVYWERNKAAIVFPWESGFMFICKESLTLTDNECLALNLVESPYNVLSGEKEFYKELYGRMNQP